jgi:hypothetical protein
LQSSTGRSSKDSKDKPYLQRLENSLCPMLRYSRFTFFVSFRFRDLTFFIQATYSGVPVYEMWVDSDAILYAV